MFDLTGRTAVVTGAGRGIGAAVAVGLAQAGADIIGVSRTMHEGDLPRRIADVGRSFEHLKVDLGVREEACTLAQELSQRTVDILVNNAGIIRRSEAVAHPVRDWDAVIELNLTVPFLLSQGAAKGMAQHHWGRIIMMASMQSFRGGTGLVSYAASKSGLPGLVRALAAEWAGDGITVNAIAPGYIRTEMTATRQADPERNRRLLEAVPAGRWGEVDDLVGTVRYLCSDAASFVHGATIPVDGGWLAG